MKCQLCRKEQVITAGIKNNITNLTGRIVKNYEKN